VFSTAVKAQVSTSPRDIPYGENRIIVRWNKTRWRCREDYCERGSFTESIEQVMAGRGLPGGCLNAVAEAVFRPIGWLLAASIDPSRSQCFRRADLGTPSTQTVHAFR
jgi:hypothetical protein